jgi:translation initiation factor 6 (eIF-6)
VRYSYSRVSPFEQVLLTDIFKITSVFEAELQDVIPICHATIAGTRIVGRLTAGYVFLFVWRLQRNETPGASGEKREPWS